MGRMPPPPEGCETQKAFSLRVGLTPGRISQLAKRGLPLTAKGHVQIAPALAWIEANLDPARRARPQAPVRAEARLPPAGAKEDDASYAEARRQHEWEKVRLARLRFDVERGALVELDKVARTVTDRARLERDAWLSWAMRTAPILSTELQTDAGATFAALDRLVREHLVTLADTPIEGLNNG